MVIQYLDSNEVVTQRVSTSDSKDSTWTPPVHTPAPKVGPQTFTLILNTGGGSTYCNNQDGTIQGFWGAGTPANPAGYNTFSAVSNVIDEQIDVAVSSILSSLTYVSPTSNKRVLRIFYQTSTGDIRNIYHTDADGSLGFAVDATVIASDLTVGTPFAVSCITDPSNTTNKLVMAIQYRDQSGVMKQRWSPSDNANSFWSTPITIPT